MRSVKEILESSNEHLVMRISGKVLHQVAELLELHTPTECLYGICTFIRVGLDSEELQRRIRELGDEEGPSRDESQYECFDPDHI